MLTRKELTAELRKLIRKACKVNGFKDLPSYYNEHGAHYTRTAVTLSRGTVSEQVKGDIIRLVCPEDVEITTDIINRLRAARSQTDTLMAELLNRVCYRLRISKRTELAELFCIHINTLTKLYNWNYKLSNYVYVRLLLGPLDAEERELLEVINKERFAGYQERLD